MSSLTLYSGTIKASVTTENLPIFSWNDGENYYSSLTLYTEKYCDKKKITNYGKMAWIWMMLKRYCNIYCSEWMRWVFGASWMK